MSPQQGRSLERLVHTLARSLSTHGGAKIEAPKRLIDSRTGKLREHDVVITVSEGLHSVVIAIECRDRSRPFGVPHLEAFRQKCLDTGVSRGVVVSPRGFRATARTKAQSYAIQCLDLDEVDGFDWLALSVLPVYAQRLLHIDLTLLLDAPGYEAVRDPQILFRVEGTSNDITVDALREHLRQYLVTHAHAISEAGKFRMPFDLGSHGLLVVIPSTQETHTVRRLQGSAYFEVERHETSFRTVRYGEAHDPEGQVEVAVAPISVGSLRGEFVVLTRRDGGQVVFVPERPAGVAR